MKKLIILLLSALLVLTSCAGGEASDISQDAVSFGEQSETGEEVPKEESLPAEESEVSAEDTSVPEESEVSVPDETSKTPEVSIPDETSKESEESIPEETSKEPDVSEPEKTDAAVEQALKLIEQGKTKESYEVLYKSGSDAAKEMLKDFVVVYTKYESVFSWDYNGSIISKVVATLTCDENGFIIHDYAESSLSSLRFTVERTYVNDEHGKPITCVHVYTSNDSGTENGVKSEITFSYDDRGNMIMSVSVADTDTTITELEYDDNNNIIYESSVNEAVGLNAANHYRYDYDENGNITKKYELVNYGKDDEYIYSYDEYFYDSDGKLSKIESYSNQGDADEPKFSLSDIENYTYNEYGILMKTVRNVVLGNLNQTDTATYSDYLFFYRPQK